MPTLYPSPYGRTTLYYNTEREGRGPERQEDATEYADRIRAYHALHAYEGLEDLENDGDEDAARLREKLFDKFIDAWEELRPAVVGER